MDMEPLTRWSSLSRVVDPRLKNHQVILGLSLISGALGLAFGYLINQSAFIVALGLGFSCGLSAFLSWVLSRELDPDHPNSGLIAPILVVPAVLVLGSPAIIAGFWVVVLLRVLNRSTGLPAKPLDSLGLAALSIWVGLTLHPLALLLGSLAMVVDRWLPEGHPYHGPLGALATVIALAYILVFGVTVELSPTTNLLWAAAVAAIFYLAAVLSQENPMAPCDFADRQISVWRVRAAQIAALVIALLFIAALGQQAVVLQSPLWAAMIGMAGFEFAQRMS